MTRQDETRRDETRQDQNRQDQTRHDKTKENKTTRPIEGQHYGRQTHTTQAILKLLQDTTRQKKTRQQDPSKVSTMGGKHTPHNHFETAASAYSLKIKVCNWWINIVQM
jgi:hypothetical protein